MAGEAGALDVTGDAAVQRLPRRLARPDEERPVPVGVPPRAEQRPPGGEPRLRVAGLTELPGVVAVGARARAGVRVGGMAGQVTRGMIAPPAGGIGEMAREAVVPGVAAGAAPHRRRRDRAVPLPPLGGVTRGRAPGRPRARARARPGPGRRKRRAADPTAMRAQATLPGVPRCAAPPRACRERAMPA